MQGMRNPAFPGKKTRKLAVIPTLRIKDDG